MSRLPEDLERLLHDLRGPLNAVAMHAVVLKRAVADDPSAAASVRTIQAELERLAAMLASTMSIVALERRELRNVVQRAVVLSGTGLIDPEHLPDTILRATPAPEPRQNATVVPIREMERDAILRALEETNQDKRRAAQLLGISLKTLYNKLAKYGIQAVKSARIT